MDWTNTHRNTVQKATTMAEPADAWTWLRLQSYCHSQENGGRIVGAKEWTARLWMMNTFCLPEEVLKECPLWRFEGVDLVVEFYPLENEKAALAKRRGNHKGGRNRWRNLAHDLGQPNGQPHARPEGQPNGQPSLPLVPPPNTPPSIPPLKKKGKERKEEEGSSSLTVCIPTVEEVCAWAMERGVDPDYARDKWLEACEGHWWVQNGTLIDWQSRWLRFWHQDQGGFQKSKKNGAAQKLAAEFRLDADPADWWEDDSERLNGQLFGMSQNPERQKEFFRLRDILNFRRKHGL